MNRLRLAGLFAGTVLLAACSQDTVPPTSPAFEPQFAKKGGGGTADPRTTFRFPTDDTGLNLRGDGNYVSGNYSDYADGVCGVNSLIFIGNGGGDAIMHTNNPKHSDRKCADYPREVTMVYPGGGQESFPTFINVRSLHNGTTSAIEIGDRELRTLNLQGAACGSWRWGNRQDSGTDMVWVERVDARTWRVYTQDIAGTGGNLARCTGDESELGLTVDFLVVADQDL